MKPLLSFAADLAQRYVESLAQRRVAPTAEAIQRLARFDLPLQEHCIDAHEVIEELDAGVTPATVAHIAALAAARHAVLGKVGWNVEADGLFGAPPITVVVSEEAHPTLLKALGVVGLGRKRIVKVPTDGQGRMRADALPSLSGPAIVCLQVGNVNTGASDPAPQICDYAHTHGAWVHVDGAFGLWARV